MTQFWLNNPSILMKKDNILNIWPKKNMEQNEKLNSITRLVIILSVIGYTLTENIKFIITLFITLGVIIFLFKTQYLVKEKFTNASTYNEIKDNFTQPNEKNPLMNVMLNDYKDNPKRKVAAPSFNPVVENKINEETKKLVINNFEDPEIEKKLFKDLGDSINFENSMRSWYSMPNTQIPNDQNSFVKFCYGDMPSCKENDGLQCIKDNARIGQVFN